MSVKDLLQVQAGKETTFGTSVAATVKFMGIETISLTPGATAAVNADMRGSLGPGAIAYVTANSGSGKLTTKVLYEDFDYWLEALFGAATPSGSNPYTRNYAAPGSAIPVSPRIQSLYYGDASGTYKLLGALPSKMTIKGESNKELRADIELIGTEVTTGTLAALSDRAVVAAMGQHTTIYIDAWGGTIGTTAIATSAYSFELGLDSGRTLKTYLGSLKPQAFQDQRYTAENNTLSLSLEFNATTKAYLDSIIAGTLSQYQVRIKSQSGTSVVQFDFAGTALTAPEIFSDKDGVCTLDMELSATYNSALGNWFKAQTVNGVATLV